MKKLIQLNLMQEAIDIITSRLQTDVDTMSRWAIRALNEGRTKDAKHHARDTKTISDVLQNIELSINY